MNLSINYLEKLQESERLTDTINEIINILLIAINDWPTSIITLKDYEMQLYKLMGDNITKKTMEKYISSIDYFKNAWEAESLSQLIEIYDYYEESKSLNEIFNEIKNIIKE